MKRRSPGAPLVAAVVLAAAAVVLLVSQLRDDPAPSDRPRPEWGVGAARRSPLAAPPGGRRPRGERFADRSRGVGSPAASSAARRSLARDEAVDPTEAMSRLPGAAGDAAEVGARRGATLSGWVSNPRGEAVSGAEVALTAVRPRYTGRVETDAEGGFEFGDLAPGTGYRLRVRPPAGVPLHDETLSLDLDAAPQRVDVSLRAKGHGRLRIALADTHGEPARQLALSVRDAANRHARARFRTDDAGRLTLNDVPSGNLILESIEGPKLTVSGLRIDPGEEVEADVIAALGDDAIEGLVVSSDGEPLVGVRVEAVWTQRDGVLRSSVVQTARTDGQGRFALAGLGAGRFAIRAVIAGFERQERDITVPVAGGPLRLVLAAAAR